MNKTLDQKRAAHAWKAIAEMGKGEDAKEYAREAKKLPVRIMAAGLGQGLVFIAAKAGKKPKLKKLTSDLSDWVLGHCGLASGQGGDLLKRIIDGDSIFLRRATDETLAYLQWLNRFSESEGLTDED